VNLRIEIEREEDGRCLAEVPQLPGVLAYRLTAEEPARNAEALALLVLAGRPEQGEAMPVDISL
jgi:predicted RNase H-like HicB family nuclease